MLPSDKIRLQHMLSASRDALTFSKGKKRDDLDKDRMLVLSILKCIEIIGEAASKVGDETKGQLASIPWINIVAMRNRLIHTYYDVNLDIVWDTLNNELPDLVTELQSVLDQ
jgi:uncharacterized protein with HEPN domain